MRATPLLVAGAMAQLVLCNPLEHRDNQLLARKSCGSNLQVCSPSGAKSESLPALGSDLSSLYVSLLDSAKGINFKRSPAAAIELDEDHRLSRRDNTPSFCCATGTSCLTLSTYAVPFCYDKFTTNFILPDGASGTIHDGSFSAADGSTADLLTGDFRNKTSGTSGNIYSADAAAKPNTATLSIPPQYTASGVGSAIPLTALGTVVVVTTTVPQTVLSPTTVPASTTVTAATTVPAHETVMTVSSAAAAHAGAAAAGRAQDADGALAAAVAAAAYALFAI